MLQSLIDYGERCNGLRFGEQADLFAPLTGDLNLALMSGSAPVQLLAGGRWYDLRGDPPDRKVRLSNARFNLVRIISPAIQTPWVFRWTIEFEAPGVTWWQDFEVRCSGRARPTEDAVHWECQIVRAERYRLPRYKDGDLGVSAQAGASAQDKR